MKRGNFCLPQSLSRMKSILAGPHRRRWPAAVLSAAVASAIGVSTASGTELSWDAAGLMPIQGGIGLWDTTSPRWFDGTGFVPWSDAGNHDAVFGGMGGSAILTAPRAANSLTFLSDYSLLNPAGGVATITLGADGAVNTGASTVEIFNPFSAPAALNKNGSGVLVLHGDTNAPGGWNINAGTFAPGGAILSAAGPLNIAADATLDMHMLGSANTATFGALNGAGSIRLGASVGDPAAIGARITVGADNASGTWSGVISGDGGRLLKAGFGALTIDNAQTYTGITQITGGAIVLEANGALAPESTIFFSGSGGIQLNGDKTLGSLAGGSASTIVNMGASSLSIGGDNRSTQFTGSVAGSGRLVKIGSGIQLFNTTASTWTGGLMVQEGTFLGSADSRFGAIPGAADPVNIILDGGTVGNLFNTSTTLNVNRGIHVTENSGGILVPGANNTFTVPGAISGIGRIAKTGAGVLSVSGANSFGGGADILEGQVTATASSGSPLGSGPILIDGANYTVAPAFAGMPVSLTHGEISYGPGANLVLNRGSNPSLAASFGQMQREFGGTLVIVPSSGIAQLGATGTTNFVHFTATGVANNVNGGVPLVNGDIASPSIISATAAGNPTGEFVRYGASGFSIGTYSTVTNINLATNTDVFNTTANQSIGTLGASVFAMNLRSGVTVSGGTLTVGAGFDEPATIILNGGTLSASTVSFDDRPGVLYAGGATTATVSTINSTLSGFGGLTKIGEGNLRINSPIEVFGGLTIAGGTLTMGASNLMPLFADVTLIGRGASGTLTTARLALNGTQQTVSTLTSNGIGTVVDLGSGGTLIVSGDANTQYRGTITGSNQSTLIKEGPGTLTLGEDVNLSSIQNPANGYQRLVMRDEGVVAITNASSLPPALNPSQFAVLPDTLRFDNGRLRIDGVNTSQLVSGSTISLASGTLQRGVTLLGGGGIIDVVDPQQTALLQVSDTVSRNIITGTGNLGKAGDGALRLGPGNTYTGATVILRGALQVPADSALGTAPSFYITDDIQIQNGGIFEPIGNLALNQNRGITLIRGAGTISNLNAQATLDTSNGDLVVNAPIIGSGALKKTGPGTLTLNAPNDFSGNFVVEGGRVNLNESGAAGFGLIVVRPQSPVTLANESPFDTSLNNFITLESGSSVTIHTPADAGYLNLWGDINGANGFTKTGGGTLALGGIDSDFAGNVYVLEGTVVVNAEGALGSPAGATFIAPGASIAFEEDVVHASPEPLFVAGNGAGTGAIQNIFGDNVFAGPVTLVNHATVNVDFGSLRVGRVKGASVLTKVGDGDLTVERVRTAGLVVSENTVRLEQKPAINNPDDTSRVNALQLAGGSTPTAALDITNNALVVDYTGGSPLAELRAQIAHAYNGGAWNQPGITSSLANQSQFGIAYAEASSLASVPAVFGDVDSTAVLIRFTRYGDANLDGVVNLADFNRLAANFGSTNALWFQGDFNYDGIVNLADFNRLAANFGLAAGPDGPTPEDWSALLAAVPEPPMAGVLGFAALGLAGRRRHRRA